MTIKELDQLIEEGNSLKVIAQSYSEIANQKIKRLRSQLEINRLFFQDIFKVYALVKSLADKKKVTILRPKKSISIVITSNYRFYGTINSQLIDFFLKSTEKIETDKVILGKAAAEYFKHFPVYKNYREVILKTDTPDSLELNNLVNIIKDYNQVLIFYSKMKSLLLQEAAFTDITATTEKAPLGQNTTSHFIFEPELSKILAFFDSQILTLLLEETFLESEVSRTASRFISMDQAETASIKVLKEYEGLKAYAERNLRNNQLLESIASILSVRKEETYE